MLNLHAHRECWPRPTLWAALTLLASPWAHADLVRITSINGNYDPNRPDVVDVRPGDVVQLAADIFTVDGSGNQYDPQNRPLEDFVWSSDLTESTECDAGSEQDCLEDSHFEITNYGVNFYVPADLGQQAQISVQFRDARGEAGSWDSITLRNVAYQEIPNYTPPTQVISDPEEYSYDIFDSTYALAGHGNWVTISGSRYWVPTHHRTDWYPYQNGYWTWTDAGWTWISHDPWGWYTDHYGIWRRHASFGWIWHPYADRVWRPHSVTWVYGDGYIGWYPYNDGYRQGYRHGYSDGFIDGYWEGYRAGMLYGAVGYGHWIPGYTFVSFAHFGARNIYDVYLRDPRIAWGHWRNAWGAGRYGSWPGGVAFGPSRVWVETRCGFSVVTTRIGSRLFGGWQMRYPVRVHAVPAGYARPSGYHGYALRRPISVGAVVQAGGHGRAPVTVVRPLAGPRGVSLAPRVSLPGGQVGVLPPRSRAPSLPSREHGIVRPIPPADHLQPSRGAWNPPGVPGGGVLPTVNPPRFSPRQPISAPSGRAPQFDHGGNGIPGGAPQPRFTAPPVSQPIAPVTPGMQPQPRFSVTPGLQPQPRFSGTPGMQPQPRFSGTPGMQPQPRFSGTPGVQPPRMSPGFGGGSTPFPPPQPVAPVTPGMQPQPRFSGTPGVQPQPRFSGTPGVQPPRVSPGFGGGSTPFPPPQPVAPVTPGMQPQPRFSGTPGMQPQPRFSGTPGVQPPRVSPGFGGGSTPFPPPQPVAPVTPGMQPQPRFSGTPGIQPQPRFSGTPGVQPPRVSPGFGGGSTPFPPPQPVAPVQPPRVSPGFGGGGFPRVSPPGPGR